MRRLGRSPCFLQSILNPFYLPADKVDLRSQPILFRFKGAHPPQQKGPYGLSKEQLRALSLTEKQALFAKLPLLKYQGKLLSGSEFLNLIYHFPYPEKNAWQRLKFSLEEQMIEILAAGILSFGTAPPILLFAEKIANRLTGARPLIPKKGIDEKVFEQFCQQHLSSVSGNPVEVFHLRQVLSALGFIFSNDFAGQDITLKNDPLIFTQTAKRMIKAPIKSFPIQSTLNNHTFARAIEENAYFGF